jgi:hypothetical protein
VQELVSSCFIAAFARLPNASTGADAVIDSVLPAAPALCAARETRCGLACKQKRPCALRRRADA